ncbi:ABC transporter substrate-binding protein [Actinocorallia aurea]
MKRAVPVMRLLAVASAASLVLAACGGGDDEGDAGASPSAATNTGDGTLTIGSILPQTGSLAFLGPPEFAGVDLAAKEINAAGGVLGKPVTITHKDSGDATTDTASKSVDSLLQAKADAIVGAASSGVSLTVIDKITNAGVVQFSPANTSDQLSTYDDKGLYFRTAPPDKLQGRVLADTIAEDGNEKVYILNRQDSYGTGLAGAIKTNLESGGVEVVGTKEYDEGAQEFSAEVSDVKAKAPDAIALVTFEEITKIGPELIKQGLGPDKVKWYFVDGNLSDQSAAAAKKSGTEPAFKEGQLKGVKGTLPGAAASDDFKKKLLGINPDLSDYSYAPESYDATNLIALAAVAGKSDAGVDIAKNLAAVSKGGEKCKDFASCKKLLDEGKDIDYDGVSGPVEFNDNGDPAEATIGVYEYQTDNTYKNVSYKTGTID